MRKTITLAIGLAASALSNAQNWPSASRSPKTPTDRSQLRLEETVYKADSTKNYYLYNDTYLLSSVTKYWYDAKGRETKKEYYSSGKLSSQTTSQYDAADNEIFYQNLNFSPTGDTTSGSRNKYAYDGDNQTFYQREEYNASTHSWNIVDGDKRLLQKDSKGNVTSLISQEYVEDAYVNSSKEEFTYNSTNQVVTYMESIWTGTEWEPSISYYDIVWQDEEEFRFKSTKIQAWDGSKWIQQYVVTGQQLGNNWVEQTDTVIGSSTQPFSRETSGITPVASLKGEVFSYNKSESYVDGAWITEREYVPTVLANGNIKTVRTSPTSRYTEEFNTYGNRVSYSSESDKGQGLELDNSSKYTITYDAYGNLASVVLEYYSSSTKTWANGGKTVYSNYQPYEANGIAEDAFAAQSLSAYPNPSTDGVFQLSQSLPFQVRNASGALVQESEGTQINLTGQPSGIYFLQLRVSGTTLQKKLVIK